jgi:hypothetical protein
MMFEFSDTGKVKNGTFSKTSTETTTVKHSLRTPHSKKVTQNAHVGNGTSKKHQIWVTKSGPSPHFFTRKLVHHQFKSDTFQASSPFFVPINGIFHAAEGNP